jgi:palmitoyltransferase
MARTSAAPDPTKSADDVQGDDPAKADAKAKAKRSRRGASEKAQSTWRLALRRAFRDIIRTVARIVDNGVRAFHVIMKIIGPCFICLALGLIGFCTYTYFTYLLPAMEETWGKFGQANLTAIGVFLLLNTLYNYGKSATMDPGLPPEFDESLLVASEESQGPPPRQCRHCGRLKPERAHHCSVCRRCVLKMDHHCPWINNCVGFGNYRHFCLFLLYLALSCLFVITTFFPVFYDAINFRRRDRRFGRNARQSIMTSFMIACSILVALSILGGFHFYLVLTNQTTIEFQLNLLHRREARKNGEFFRNPYDMGRRRNFQQVFGPNPFCYFRWMMPYIAAPPTGDGMTYAGLRV